MQLEIIETPLRFYLHGLSGEVQNDRFAETGLRLMDQMWQVVKEKGIPNTGINHWVYLGGGRMFVGVELREVESALVANPLEPLEFVLPRYLKHLHVGPYQLLPQKWQALTAELAARGEKVQFPSLEVYGNHCEDAAAQETTILLSLETVT